MWVGKGSVFSVFGLSVGLCPQAASLEMPSGVREGRLEDLVPVGSL